MQRQRGINNLFAETIDLNQGTVSSNNSSNPPTSWNNILYPMETNNIRNFGGWHIGESSSSTNPNQQSQGLGTNLESESSFETPQPVVSSNSLFRESLSRPLNINLNAEHVASGSDGGPENFDDFRYNIENNDGSSSSFGDWGSSVKRKALDNTSSNSFNQGETFDRNDFHSGSSNIDTYSPPIRPPNFSHSEELNLRIGIGRGITSDIFPPITVRETGESSARNYGIRINNDNDNFNLPSTRNATSFPDFRNRHHASRPISPPENFEFRPVSNSERNSDLPRNTPPFATHRAVERGFLPRNSTENSPFAHFAEIRNNLNLPSENNRNNLFSSSRNVNRQSQFYPWAPFPSGESEAVNWRAGHFPPLRPSSEDTMMSSGGHHRDTQFVRSSGLELPGEDVSGWHALAADIEGRQRLVSEIRHVLNAMRRGDNLRDEDYMLFDPFINGIAELHDRHRDMRLDVDNMSYEELLALEERIGDVNTGLSEEAILKMLKKRKHLCLFDRSSSTLEPCSICREEYVLGDDVGELDCGHDFHTDCIKQWLTQKNICPICKMTALGT